MNKVTLDYSKAGCFIADHEIESMKSARTGCKRDSGVQKRCWQ